MRRFNLNGFFALDAILRSATLTEAAQSVNLSQPAMSLALKKLRDFFGDELVRYKQGRAELSPLALQLQPKIADLLLRSEEVLEMSRAFDPLSEERTLTIAAPESTLLSFLPGLIARSAVEAPGIHLKTVSTPIDPAAKLDIDLSILPARGSYEDSDILPVFSESFSCLVHVEMGITALNSALFLSLDHAALSFEQEAQYWPEMSQAHDLLRGRRVLATARRLEALPHLAINRRLIVTGTTRFTQHHAAIFPWLISVPAPDALVPVTLVASAARSADPASRWLMRLVGAAAEPYTPGGLASLTG